MTILSSIMQFAMLPLQGITQGGQPIISYNYGAKKIDRIKQAFKLQTISCVVYATSFGSLPSLRRRYLYLYSQAIRSWQNCHNGRFAFIWHVSSLWAFRFPASNIYRIRKF